MSSELKLAEAARKFETLESDFLKYTYETKKPLTDESRLQFLKEALHIAEKAYQTKQEILESFGQMSKIMVSDPSVQQLLEKIRRDERFYSISFYEAMVEVLKASADNAGHLPYTIDIISDLIEKKWDNFFEDFHSWFDLNGYFYAQMKIGPIISSFKVPEHLLVYFREIRETFAFEQYRAAIALCRALLEMCLYRKLSAKRAFINRGAGSVVPIQNAKEDSLFRFINIAEKCRLLSESEAKTAHGIRDRANKILHVKESLTMPSETTTLNIIWDTMSILQRLYR